MNNNSGNINNSSIVKIYLMLLIFFIFSVNSSYAEQPVFSIQAGSYNNLSTAQKKYDLIAQKSSQMDLDSLRIEKIGKSYTVRIGKIENYAAAKEFLEIVKPQISEAVITKAYIKNERIIKILKDRLSAGKGRNSRAVLPIRITEKVRPLIKKAGINKKNPSSTKTINKKNPGFRAIKEYPQTIDLGMYRPDYFRKISIALFKRGFIDEAIVELKRAIKLTPDNPLYRIELGTLYLARDNLEKAKEQYYSALRINPALSRVYYYLGELFIETGDLDMAWLSASMSRNLGLSDNDLTRKLGTLSKEPDLPSWNINEDELYMRQILVFSNDKAKKIMKRFSEGELFENLAINESYGPSSINGGYVGRVRSSEIHPEIAGALHEKEVFADPVIVRTENGFHIVQRIAPFELDFMEKLLSGSSKKTARKSSKQQFSKTLSSLR